MITTEIAHSINQCVLCWLATNSDDGFPNVSPKEAFVYDGVSKILVANIASPKTVENIEKDERVCFSLVDIFIQKGFKIKGVATIQKPDSPDYELKLKKLTDYIGTTFPISSVIEIEPTHIEEIVAPSYHLFPETGACDRIEESLKAYKVVDYQKRLADAKGNTD